MNFNKLYNLLLEDVTPSKNDTYESIELKLKKEGWSFLGRGCYGTVFGNPNKDYVLKLYNDEAYDEYVEFIKQHSDNPHVVRIKEILSSGFGPNSEYKLIAIEKLNPVQFPKWIDNIASYYSSFLDNYHYSEFDDFYSTIESFEQYMSSGTEKDIEFYKINKNKRQEHNIKKSIRRLGFFIENYIDLFRILFELNKFQESNSFDLHTGNFMRRPSTGEIVVTDPLYKG